MTPTRMHAYGFCGACICDSAVYPAAAGRQAQCTYTCMHRSDVSLPRAQLQAAQERLKSAIKCEYLESLKRLLASFDGDREALHAAGKFLFGLGLRVEDNPKRVTLTRVGAWCERVGRDACMEGARLDGPHPDSRTALCTYLSTYLPTYLLYLPTYLPAPCARIVAAVRPSLLPARAAGTCWLTQVTC